LLDAKHICEKRDNRNAGAVQLAKKKLTKQQVRGLKALALAEQRFEPLELAARIKFEVADQLVAMGLAETGD
jgi:hypothetical protein